MTTSAWPETLVHLGMETLLLVTLYLYIQRFKIRLNKKKTSSIYLK